MKKGYLVVLMAGYVMWMAGCGRQDPGEANRQETPAVTEDAGADTDVTEDAQDGTSQTAAATGESGISAGDATNASDKDSGSQKGTDDQKSTTSQDDQKASGDRKDSDSGQKDIGVEAAKKIALTKAGLTEQDGSWKKEKKDKEHGRDVYDLEFVSGDMEYEFEIDIQNGDILEYQKEHVND